MGKRTKNQPQKRETILTEEKLARLLGREITIPPLPLTMTYPLARLRWEILKSTLGALACWALILGLAPVLFVAIPIGLVGALFTYYTVQQLVRLFLRLEVDKSGVTLHLGSRQQQTLWKDLSFLRLHYYPQGKKASAGTLVLTLRGKTGKIKVDSGLDHFPSLLTRAAAAARKNKLELHPTTESNLKELEL